MSNDANNEISDLEFISFSTQKREAEFYHDLFFDSKWITRRVESISIKDSEHWEHRVSVDIDRHRLKAKVNCQLSVDRTRLPVPIDVLDLQGSTL